ncbi:MAG: OmpA family protein [Oceanospirillales bacterium]|uniref:OmpA family protein n=1 Tax=Marinobacterium halophilum TaxID=267374 RepID=A0A2P8EVD0_9GAMM|nr:OmpA family protein [Marinobacterium halophilum]MBR9830235.1 OmpA family protein [Oceanospirillales bacterium]PSL13424.1 OmpA family protein [Marinobacterium halophilum]
MKLKLLLPCVLSAMVAMPLMAANGDRKGAEDHPLISRFPDTHINSYYTSEYDEFLVATGPRDPDQPMPPVLRLEGKVTTLGYEANDRKYSALQIFRNYEKAFAQAGFTPIYTCRTDNECGRRFVSQLYWEGVSARRGRDHGLDAPNLHGDRHPYFYWSGKADIQGKEIYATLLVDQTSGGRFPTKVVLDIGEIETLDTDRISINLDGMNKAIAETGKVELEGVLFDTAKATLKAESADVVTTIADYLQQNPVKSFYVVGHTDSQGDFNFNMRLSKSRADTVVTTLVREHGIEAGRLTAVGVGPASPVLSNSTDAGRTKNRRVELVLAD